MARGWMTFRRKPRIVVTNALKHFAHNLSAIENFWNSFPIPQTICLRGAAMISSVSWMFRVNEWTVQDVWRVLHRLCWEMKCSRTKSKPSIECARIDKRVDGQ